MTIEDELRLRAEYMNIRDRMGRYTLLGFLAFGVAAFCLFRDFWQGAVIAAGIRIYIHFVVIDCVKQLQQLEDRYESE